MSDLTNEVSKQIELSEVEQDEEPHKADSAHLDDPHGLLSKPGIKGTFGPKGKDSSKANSS